MNLPPPSPRNIHTQTHTHRHTDTQTHTHTRHLHELFSKPPRKSYVRREHTAPGRGGTIWFGLEVFN